MKSKLLTRTLHLLNTRPDTCTLELISVKTGLTVAWLRDIENGRIVEPSVVKIETLHDYLSPQKLKMPTR